MKEFAIMGMYFAALVSIFGMAAWLLYLRVPGGGWFLVVVAIYSLGTSMKVNSKGEDGQKETGNAK